MAIDKSERENEHERASDPTFALPSRPQAAVALPNAVAAALLRSPLHGLLSGSAILLSFRGRKSGRRYTFPVGYYQRHGDTLVVVPLHRWWTNLREETPIVVWLKGRKYEAIARVADRDDATLAELEAIVRGSRALIRVCGVARDAQGRPDEQSLRQVAQTLALIRIRLNS